MGFTRWWTKDKAMIALRRRWRNSYKRAARKIREELEKEYDEKLAKEVAWVKAIYTRDECELREQVSKLAADVMRVRVALRHEPQFGRRWMMYVQFADTYMRHAHDLRDTVPFIIEHLCAQLKREAAMIDFARMKPIDFTFPHDRQSPMWFTKFLGDDNGLER